MSGQMRTLLQKARTELGPTGVLSLGLIGATVVFLIAAVRPLEERSRSLESRLAQVERRDAGPAAARAGPSGVAARLAAFYTFFQTAERPTDWLARLHAIAGRSGIELGSADYRLQRAPGRLERYEIVLPVTATYPQLRAFLTGALAEIPVLSLDQVVIKRPRASDGQVQAEVHATLHAVKP